MQWWQYFYIWRSIAMKHSVCRSVNSCKQSDPLMLGGVCPYHFVNKCQSGFLKFSRCCTVFEATVKLLATRIIKLCQHDFFRAHLKNIKGEKVPVCESRGRLNMVYTFVYYVLYIYTQYYEKHLC